jgi:hypothetical protein
VSKVTCYGINLGQVGAPVGGGAAAGESAGWGEDWAGGGLEQRGGGKEMYCALSVDCVTEAETERDREREREREPPLSGAVVKDGIERAGAAAGKAGSVVVSVGPVVEEGEEGEEEEGEEEGEEEEGEEEEEEEEEKEKEVQEEEVYH